MTQPTTEVVEHETMGAVRVVGLLAAVALVIWTHNVLTVLVVLAVILMVVVHELGHFLTAKASGMKVTEYFLGFGPKLWSHTWGETEYGIKLIPAGAYVKIIGMNNLEEVDAADEPRTYRQQPYWQRVMVASAGSFMHFVMAFLILVVINGVVGTASGTPSTSVDSVGVVAGGAGPAGKAGVQKGDKIISVAGMPITQWSDVAASVADKANQPVQIVVERDGKPLMVTATPLQRSAVVLRDGTRLTTDPADKTGFLGLQPAPKYVTVGLFAAMGDSATQMWDGAKQVVSTLVHRFSPSGISDWASQVWHANSNREERQALQKEQNNPGVATSADPSQPSPVAQAVAQQQAEDSNRLISPLGLFNFADYAANAGLREVLALLYSINIFVGIFNMVPLLPFDGGHVAVASYERLRSFRGKTHAVDFNKLVRLSYVVLLVLVVMGVSALWLDLVDPVSNPFS